MHSLQSHDLRRIHFLMGQLIVKSASGLVVLDEIALDVRSRLCF